jgi:general secretion pathway protein I
VKGFTLLEVMIALAIMAGVVLTIITSFNYHLNLVGRDREETVAILVARAKLEDPEVLALTKRQGTCAPDHPEMTWQVVTAPTEITNLTRLTLMLTWGEGKRHLSLVHYVQK